MVVVSNDKAQSLYKACMLDMQDQNLKSVMNIRETQHTSFKILNHVL